MRRSMPLRRMALRALQIVLAMAAVGITYRVVFVYKLWPEPCPPLRIVTSSQLQDEPESGHLPLRGESAAVPAARELTVLSYNIGGHTALVRGGHLAAIARTIAEPNPTS